MTTENDSQNDPGQNVDLLCTIEEPGYRLRLHLENDQMECLADFQPIFPEADLELEEDPPSESADDPAKAEAGEIPESGNQEKPAEPSPAEPLPEETEPIIEEEPLLPPVISPAELIQLLHRHNIKEGIDFTALYQFCALAEERREQQDVLLAKGREPVTGKDGWFELVVKTTGEEAEFQEDEHGNVDLRTRHAFTEIKAGQKIGVLHPPQEGVPGQTVHGLPIPAERGRFYSLVAGEGVELKYDGRFAFAAKDGRALLERQVLTVVDQLVVSGDLDLKIGNIEFNGFVEVKGDVLDDFHIKASKGIKVAGVVGACKLKSDGPVVIGSVAGKERGQISCSGELVAGFLNQANVHCYGDVLVTNEIRNSVVKATGKIIVERGSIIGGSCVALEGIEAKILGATSGTATLLRAGVYFPDVERFDFLHQELQRVDSQIGRLKAAIGPLERLCDLDSATEKRLSILTEQWEKLEVERDALKAELAASTKQEQKTSNPKINAGSKLMEGVTIQLGNSSEKFKMERNGPLSIIENTKKGGFRFLGMTSLQKSAEELEQEVIEEEEAALAFALAAAEKPTAKAGDSDK